jgi:hypothetical protein
MANEAVIVELLGNQGEVIDFTIGDGVAVEKGTIMTFIDPRTCSGASAAGAGGEVIAGIAAAEKVASDGQTNLGIYTHGIFDLVCGPGVTIGAKLASSGGNVVRDATEAEIAAGKCIGKALETGTAGERIEVLVAPM